MIRIAWICIFILPLFMLMACEGNTNVDLVVENSSGVSIDVDGLTIYGDIIDATIAPGSSKSIFITDQLGGNSQAIHPSSYLDSLLIVSANSDTVNRDYCDIANWDIFIEQTRRIPAFYDHIYTFKVEDGD